MAGRAIDDPSTRRIMRRQHVFAGLHVLSGVVFLTLLLHFNGYVDRKQSDLQRNGRAVVGEVDEDVTVLIDPGDPGHVTLRGEYNHQPWQGLVMLVLFLLGVWSVVVGIGTAIHGLVLRTRLCRGTWRRRRIWWCGPRSWWRQPWMFLVEEGGVAHPLLVTNVRGGRKGLRDAHDVDVLGELPGVVFVRPVGSDLLVTARSPRNDAQRRRFEVRSNHTLNRPPVRAIPLRLSGDRRQGGRGER
jgi:hypothetical protein